MPRSRTVLGVIALLLGAAGAGAQEPPDRHAARREWLERRRLGALAPDSGEVTRDAGARPAPAPPAAGPAPHRLEGRFRPNYDAEADLRALWPLGSAWPRAGGRGMLLPWSYRGAFTCARVTVRFATGEPLPLYLLLPPAAAFDAADLELQLDAQLSAGRPVDLQTAEGAPIRVHPGSHIERLTITSCAR